MTLNRKIFESLHEVTKYAKLRDKNFYVRNRGILKQTCGVEPELQFALP